VVRRRLRRKSQGVPSSTMILVRKGAFAKIVVGASSGKGTKKESVWGGRGSGRSRIKQEEKGGSDGPAFLKGERKKFRRPKDGMALTLLIGERGPRQAGLATL